MNELRDLIEDAYKAASTGMWAQLLVEWQSSPVLARRCSRYAEESSSSTFLHQAARFGNEDACRVLIRLGASIESPMVGSLTPADVAEQHGHHGLASFLRKASIGKQRLWQPPVDPDVLPSSNRWKEAKEESAETELLVAYGGGVVKIPKGERYFSDSLDRVLVGWHGTFNPPRDMDGESILSDVS